MGSAGPQGFGSHLCERADWLAVGGYDEAISGWGAEDRDLYLRLVLLGRAERPVPPGWASVIEHADAARLSRELVKLVCDAPLPEPLDDLILKGIPPEPLRAFLEDQGFKSLLAKVGGPGPGNGSSISSPLAVSTPAQPPVPAAEAVPFDHKAYETIVDEEALDRWIAEARKAGVVAVDTETDELDCIRANLVGISLSTAPGNGCYIPVGHVGDGLLSEAPKQLPRPTVLARLKPLLEDPGVLKVGQNLKYDLIMFRRSGIDVCPYDDTMILSFDLDAGKHGHGMDELCELHVGHCPIAFKDVCGTGKSQISFDKVDLARATEYAAEDADITLRLWQKLKPRLAREAATRVYELVDRPLVPVVAEMERAGIRVDREELARLSAEFAAQITVLEGEIHALAGGPFTIGSPKQLGDVLFDKLGHKGGRKGKSGQYSTDQGILEGLAASGVSIAARVLDWRQLSKLRSTYTEALQQAINPNTQRVHTSYSLVGAQTGRLSSTEPNLQNIPIRTDIGRRIRECFVAEPGNVLLAADYSQIELRLAAHMADVASLKEAFAQGEDIHARTAQEMFGAVDRDTRARAKTVNFAILYGISRWGLATRMGTTPEEAQETIDLYFARFPGIQRYIHDTLETVRERGYSLTLFGRKTWFPRIRSANQAERQGSERAAINAPIQGTCADIIKRAMARMEPALTDAGLPDVRMLLQVHDELVFELPEGDVEAARPVIERVMAEAAEPAVKLSVPLGVEIGTGPSWGAAH